MVFTTTRTVKTSASYVRPVMLSPAAVTSSTALPRTVLVVWVQRVGGARGDDQRPDHDEDERRADRLRHLGGPSGAAWRLWRARRGERC